MARREITQFFDDLDNSPLEESEVHVISFSFDGEDFIIDLSEENAEKFREAIRPYMDKATKTVSQRTPVGHDPKDVRQWAKSKKTRRCSTRQNPTRDHRRLHPGA